MAPPLSAHTGPRKARMRLQMSTAMTPTQHVASRVETASMELHSVAPGVCGQRSGVIAQVLRSSWARVRKQAATQETPKLLVRGGVWRIWCLPGLNFWRKDDFAPTPNSLTSTRSIFAALL